MSHFPENFFYFMDGVILWDKLLSIKVKTLWFYLFLTIRRYFKTYLIILYSIIYIIVIFNI